MPSGKYASSVKTEGKKKRRKRKFSFSKRALKKLLTSIKRDIMSFNIAIVVTIITWLCCAYFVFFFFSYVIDVFVILRGVGDDSFV